MHPGLEWLRRSEEGRAWLDRLPQLLAECREQWSLELGEPFAYAFASFAVSAGDVVLKIQFPDRESEHEADALARWNGSGAVRLLAYDRERRALLLERCRPGSALRRLDPDAALDVLVDLLRRLSVAADKPFRPLAEEAAWWLAGLEEKWERAGRPFERALLDAALEALRQLPATQGAAVLLHQDLHADNVLAAEREPWLAIDPKPLVGEREFGVAPIVRGKELGHSRQAVLRRFDRVVRDLELDRERARAWTIAQTIAWSGLESDLHRQHVDVARWLLQAD